MLKINDKVELMKSRLKIVLALTSLLYIPLFASQSVSLESAYQSALKVDDYKNQIQSIKGQSEAKYDQAKALLYPNISAEGTYSDTRFKARGASEETEIVRKTVGIGLRQPLFQGGLFSGIQREKASLEVADLTVQKTNLDLYLSVSQSYNRIILLESTLEVLKEIESASNKRVEELRRRVKIGRSKQVDLLTNELQNQSIKIEIGNVEIALKTEREVFGRLTGFSTDVKLQEVPVTQTIKPLDYYLAKVDLTPDVEIQRKTVYIADKNKSIANSQHLPNLYLDLDARYGELRLNEDGREYVAQLTLEIPLFEGGRVMAAASEANWKKVQEHAKLVGLKKDTEVQIRSQHNALVQNLELFKVREKSLETARKNYQLYNKELSLGLVSNLELLNSLSDYLEAKKNREDSFFQLKLSELRLAQLVGDIN